MKRWLAPALLASLLLIAPATTQDTAPTSAEVVQASSTVVQGPQEVPQYSLVTISAQTEAKYVRIKVRKIDDWFVVISTVEARPTEEGTRTWVWTGPPGEYLTEITCFDPDTGIEDHTLAIRILGMVPPKPDDPDVPVPPTPTNCSSVVEDPFDNIGQRCCGWKPDNPPVAQQLASMYRDLASKLEDGTILDIGDSNVLLRSQKATILGTPTLEQQWKSWNDQVATDVRSRTMDRIDLVFYYRALAAGLEN